jgi:hypothetical protein
MERGFSLPHLEFCTHVVDEPAMVMAANMSGSLLEDICLAEGNISDPETSNWEHHGNNMRGG